MFVLALLLQGVPFCYLFSFILSLVSYLCIYKFKATLSLFDFYVVITTFISIIFTCTTCYFYAESLGYYLPEFFLLLLFGIYVALSWAMHRFCALGRNVALMYPTIIFLLQMLSCWVVRRCLVLINFSS
ncbi:MAG: hypothetical protein RLZ12_68 [Bacillota bacterium]